RSPDLLSRLTAFAHGLANRIGSLRAPGDRPLGLLGDFHPWTGAHDPLVAPPRDQALALYALARYATSPAIDAASRARAARSFWTIFADLAVVSEGERPLLDDPVAISFVLLALHSAPERPPGMPSPPPNLHSPASALPALSGAFDPSRGWNEALRLSERAVVA